MNPKPEAELSFRFATGADLAALLQLRLAVDANQSQRFGDRRWVTSINEKSVARGLESSRTLVASLRGGIVAALRMETKKPWAIDLSYFTPAHKAVYLHDVNVDPSLQRSSIGRQLIEQAKTVAKELPVDAIRVDTYDGAAGAAPFYEKCGFTRVGRKVYRGVPLAYLELVF